MTETAAVEVANLSVRFQQRERTIHAVNGISFRLERGEVLGILGESGAGKSVTLRSLVRLFPPNLGAGGGAWRARGGVPAPAGEPPRGTPGQPHRDDLPGAGHGARPSLHGRRAD